MDNAKSIIDIEVNDDEFKRFHDLFTKYREALKSAPEDWKASEKATDGQIDAMRDLLAAMHAQSKLLREQRDQEKLRDDAEKKANNERESAIKRQNALYKQRADMIKDIGSTLSGIVGNTASIGFNIAKWGLGVGIGMVGGGFFGLERLASSATNDRRTANTLGVSSGQLRAWQTNFGNYGDPSALLGAASNAYSDAGTRALFQRAGVGADIIRGGNTSQIAEQALRGLSEFFRANQGPNAQSIWASRGFDQIMSYNAMRAFAGRSPSEQESMFANIRRDTSAMGNSDPTLRAWQDFTTQLDRAGNELKSTFIDGLKDITGPAGELSQSLNDLVREVMHDGAFGDVMHIFANGIHEISDDFRDGSAQKAIHGFLDTVKQFVESGDFQKDMGAIQGGLHALAKILGIFSPSAPSADGSPSGDWKTGAAMGAGMGAIAGSIIPGFGTAAGAAIGGGIGAAAGGIYDELPESWRNALNGGGSGSSMGNMARYLGAIAQTESSGNRNARSSKGAMGLMQLMPGTARQYGVTNPYDVQQSVQGAARFVNDLMRQFHGDMMKVTAAYNAGGGRVQDAVSQYGSDWLSHLPSETQSYIGRVERNYQAGNHGGVNITIQNNTGGSAIVTASQAASL